MCSVGGSIGWSRCTAWALATQHMDPCTPSRALLTCPLPPIQTPRLPPAGSRRRGAGAVKQATGASGQRLKGAALVCSWQHLEEWGPPASRPQFKPSPCAGAPPPPHAPRWRTPLPFARRTPRGPCGRTAAPGTST